MSPQVTRLVEETFYLQRLEINNGFTLSVLRKSWPGLFTPLSLVKHFELLTSVELHGILERNFLSRAKDITSFLRTLNTKKLCEHFWAVDKIENPDEIIVFLSSIAIYFKEDIGSLFLASEVSNYQIYLKLKTK